MLPIMTAIMVTIMMGNIHNVILMVVKHEAHHEQGGLSCCPS